ncbi:MAG: hypothetical protein ACRDJV_08860 [Actinomycetota bacterium]
MDSGITNVLSEDEAGDGHSRRRFLRSAAITGLAAAWSAPIIQTIAPEMALAQDDQHHPRPGTPRPEDTPTGDTPDPKDCDSDCDGDTDDHQDSSDSSDSKDSKD